MYKQLCESPSDIFEHLPTLKDLASECNHVTEMGVRYIVSTYAFLEGLGSGKKLVSIDITHPAQYGGDLSNAQITAQQKGIDFSFIQADTLKIDIEPTDLLFIDTLHRYNQLKEELAKHADKARKYIAFHDTTTFATMGDDGVEGNGLWKAIEEFLAEHPEWKIKHRYTNNNGLTILQRV